MTQEVIRTGVSWNGNGANNPRIFVEVDDDFAPEIIAPALPRQLHDSFIWQTNNSYFVVIYPSRSAFSQEWDEVPGDSFFELPEQFESSASLTTQQYELTALRELSGLTWPSLATLFGVSVRMVHFWLNGQKRMSEKHGDFLNQLVRLIVILDRGPAFRNRKFFEEHVLSNKRILRLFSAGDFEKLEKWAKSLPKDYRPKALPISAQILSDRLPRPSFISQRDELPDKSSSPPSLGKTSKARVSRGPKKSQ